VIGGDSSPLLRTKDEIAEARRLFARLSPYPNAEGEAKRRRFTQADLGRLRWEAREWEALRRGY
jgi:hypothetical protein